MEVDYLQQQSAAWLGELRILLLNRIVSTRRAFGIVSDLLYSPEAASTVSNPFR